MKLIDSGERCETDSVVVPFEQFPLLAAHKAAKKGNGNNLLFITWGGIGDVICSEPTIRYALKDFKNCKITVATRHPEIFAHLALHDVYDLAKEKPILDDYLVLYTIPNQGTELLAHQFMTHMHMHCVDFPAVSALRCQLPLNDREVVLKVKAPYFADSEGASKVLNIVAEKEKYVIMHAGRHWKSKTFPPQWWNKVIDSILAAGLIPVLIGKEEGESQGYVKTKKDGCIDLRDKTTLSESIFLLQNAGVVFCNDSSPLHMAVTGKAWIGLVASVKRPEFIMHYRQGVFGWRQQDFSRDGIWNYSSVCPNRTTDLNLDDCPDDLISKVLPDPSIIGPWCAEKMHDFLRD